MPQEYAYYEVANGPLPDMKSVITWILHFPGSSTGKIELFIRSVVYELPVNDTYFFVYKLPGLRCFVTATGMHFKTAYPRFLHIS